MSAAATLERLAAAVERRVEGRWGIAVVVCFLMFAYFLGYQAKDPDLLHRLALGRFFFATGHVPLVDPFAFTPTLTQWIDHEWLSGIIFYWICNRFGDLGLFVFKCLTFVATITGLVAAQREGKLGVVFVLLCAFGSAYLWTSTVRAQVFTYAGLAYLAWAIARIELERNFFPILFVPALMIVWANTHAGFVLGLLLLGAWGLPYVALTTASGRLKSVVIASLVFSVGATLLNPYGESGLAFWRVVLGAVSMPRPSITEWEPTDLWSPGSVLIWLLLAVDVVGLMVLSRQHKAEVAAGRLLYAEGKAGLFLVFLILGFSFYCALRHQRFTALFLLANLWLGRRFWQICLDWLKRQWPDFCLKWKVAQNISLLAGCVIALALFIQAAPRFINFRLDNTGYPEAAAAWLKANGKAGRILVDFNNGSYVMWELGPKFQISLDSRFEAVYPESTVVMVSKAFDFSSEAGVKARAEIQPDYVIVPNYLIGPAGRVLPGEGFGAVLPTLYVRDSKARL